MSTNGSSSGNGQRPPTPEVEADVKPPEDMRAGGVTGRWGAAGVPLERSKDFKNSTMRLASRLAPERWGIALIMLLAVVSVTLLVIAPHILGNATDVVVSGVTSGKGIDFGKLHQTLLIAAANYAASAVLALTQGRPA